MSINTPYPSLYIEKLEKFFYLDPHHSQNDIEEFCDKINKDEILPEDIFKNCCIKTVDILKIYRIFADKITNFNISGIPNVPRNWVNCRFPQGCTKESSLWIYKQLSKLPKIGRFFSRTSEISEIVDALPHLKILKISVCNDPPSCYLRLKELRNLTSLSISHGHLDSLRHVSQLTQLEVLNLYGLVVREDLKNLKNLKELRIRYCALEKGFNFDSMPFLKKLSLIGCEMLEGKLPSIKGLYRLEEVAYLSRGCEFYEEVFTLNLKKILVNPLYFDQKKLAKIGYYFPNLEELSFFTKSSFKQEYAFNPPLYHLKRLNLENGCIFKVTGIPAVTHLKIENCANITNLRQIQAPNLENLHIKKCPNFTEIGHKFPNLKVSNIEPWRGDCDIVF